MEESILMTVRKACQVPEWDDGFDQELIVHTNTILMRLTQLGVGPRTGFFITGTQETWASFIGGSDEFKMVQSYVVLRVRLLFDPPSSSFVLESMKNQIAEFEWLLNVQAEGAFDDD